MHKSVPDHAAPEAVASQADVPVAHPSLAFSGERYIPEQGWAEIAYEHLSRYLFARALVGERDVLDIGSGEGYGSHLLAERASSVTGIDVSPEAVAHATRRYGSVSSRLRYVCGSASQLPIRSSSVNVVVAFEVLEHILQQRELLAEARRVLRPGGVLLLSSPNKRAYSDLTNYRNPFHVKELYFDELRALIDTSFPHARYFAQRNVVGSMISPVDESSDARMSVRRVRRKPGSAEFEPTALESADHLYFLVVCSESDEALESVAGLVMTDRDNRLLKEQTESSHREAAAAFEAGAAQWRDRAFADDALRAASAIAGALAMQLRTAVAAFGPVPAEQTLYDLIVPVYNAPDILQKCLDSLIANTDPRHLIHLVNDASTDQRVEPLLQRYAARHPHVRRYTLPANLGFPGAVNAAFASTSRDVVLINADTEYPPHWLARMDRCRHRDPAIHAVSPLSNNASICSVPGFNQYNDLPPGMSLAEMDELVQRTSLRRYPPVPTAVGFCMLMTRRAIDDVGPFDMTFGRGYGEEVDWCQRAWAKGYASVICDDVYVYHHGSAGFADVKEKDSLQRTNERIVAERWPRYEGTVQRYSMSNPLRFQQQRIYESVRRSYPTKLRVLHVTHNFDQLAGTEIFTRLLLDGTRHRAINTVLFPAAMSPYLDGTVELEGRGLLAGGLLKIRMNVGLSPVEFALRGGSLTLRAPYTERFFAEVVAASGAQVVQFNHLANLGSLALPLVARALGAKVVVTLHDYFLLCPDWNLLHASGVACGEPRASADNARCVDCLASRIQSRAGAAPLNVPNFVRMRTALARAVLEHADVVIAPSQFVREQYIRAWGPSIGNHIRVIPNGTVAYPFDARYRPANELRVAFVGNVGVLKGSNVFAEAARRLAGGRVRFMVLGATPSDNEVCTTANIELKGSYRPRELLGLLQDVDVVFIGSIANETYCFTLDEAFRAGVPVIATAVGAIVERVADGQTGILIPPNDVEALVGSIRRLDGDRGLLASMRAHVARLDVRSVTETISEYQDIYESLLNSTDEIDAVRRAMKGGADPIPAPAVTLAEHLAAQGLHLPLPLVSEGRPRSTSRTKR